MSIKSVNEIDFFQNLRDVEIDLSFYNAAFDIADESLIHFVNYILKSTIEEIGKDYIHKSLHIEKECLISLLDKFQNEAFKNTRKLKLSFIEMLYLYGIVNYYENNYSKFKEKVKIIDIHHYFDPFILTPSKYYNTLFKLKAYLEFNLGKAAANSYTIKHK